MNKLLLHLVLLQSLAGISQSLHSLEPISKHYKELQKLSATANPERAALDTIAFLPSSYHNVALLYTLLDPAYLSQDQIDVLKNSVAYPASSSDQTKAELEYLLDWQTKRTKEQEHRTAAVLAPLGYWPHIAVMKDHPNNKINMEHLFFEGNEVLGEECNAEKYPATAKLLKGITTDMRIMEFTVKYHLLRPRPYVVEPKLKPLAIMLSPSFASGHALWAYLHAFTWSELLPSKRQQFLELAYEIGESREIMGVHYPSDEEASRVLAHDMLSQMWSNPEFVSDFKSAALEWKNQK